MSTFSDSYYYLDSYNNVLNIATGNITQVLYGQGEYPSQLYDMQDNGQFQNITLQDNTLNVQLDIQDNNTGIPTKPQEIVAFNQNNLCIQNSPQHLKVTSSYNSFHDSQSIQEPQQIQRKPSCDIQQQQQQQSDNFPQYTRPVFCSNHQHLKSQQDNIQEGPDILQKSIIKELSQVKITPNKKIKIVESTQPQSCQPPIDFTQEQLQLQHQLFKITNLQENNQDTNDTETSETQSRRGSHNSVTSKPAQFYQSPFNRQAAYENFLQQQNVNIHSHQFSIDNLQNYRNDNLNESIKVQNLKIPNKPLVSEAALASKAFKERSSTTADYTNTEFQMSITPLKRSVSQRQRNISAILRDPDFVS